MVFFNDIKRIEQGCIISVESYLLNLQSLFMIISCVPSFFVKASVQNDMNKIFVKKKHVLPAFFFMVKHTLTLYKTLTDLTAVDTLLPSGRFKILYNLLSMTFNHRTFLYTKKNEPTSLDSIVPIFANANWLERETWDMFGVTFNNHPDLRRILTDYGFDGHPLRKDFPLTGFNEIFYSDTNKSICYTKVSLAQEYRSFEFVNSWTS